MSASPVNSIMTPDPVSCRAETPLHEVARMMVDNDCGQIPVVDQDRKPIGVVTDRDIVVKVVASARSSADAKAADAMTAPCKTVTSDTDLSVCTRLMEADQIRRIPVVDRDGKLVGIVSIADIALAGQDRTTADVVKKVSKPGVD